MPQHDALFKDLITNRDFALSFLQHYLPVDLREKIDWQSVQLDSANVEHTRQQHKAQKKQHERSDLAFLFHLRNGDLGAIFVHIEAQTSDDGTLVLRVRHYQTAYLLDFIKRNQGVKKLPLVFTIIYYANQKPFSHSLDIYDYFEYPDLAREYAFRVQFVDINRLSDDEILDHGTISGYEYILKHIQARDLDGHLGVAVKQLSGYDQITRQVLIRYMSQYSELAPETFYRQMIDYAPSLEGDVMSVAQQWEQQGVMKGMEQGMMKGMEQGMMRGMEQGITKGMEQGITKGMEQGITKGMEQGINGAHLEMSKKLLMQDYSVEMVSELIGWPLEKVKRLKDQLVRS